MMPHTWFFRCIDLQLPCGAVVPVHRSPASVWSSSVQGLQLSPLKLIAEVRGAAFCFARFFLSYYLGNYVFVFNETRQNLSLV
jgi:hypothetical protein